jgi:hypothetical protein
MLTSSNIKKIAVGIIAIAALSAGAYAINVSTHNSEVVSSMPDSNISSINISSDTSVIDSTSAQNAESSSVDASSTAQSEVSSKAASTTSSKVSSSTANSQGNTSTYTADDGTVITAIWAVSTSNGASKGNDTSATTEP